MDMKILTFDKNDQMKQNKKRNEAEQGALKYPLEHNKVNREVLKCP